MMRIITKHSTIIVVLVIVLSAAIGFTAARQMLYTEQRNNNFLFGDVKINLMEENWDKLTEEDKILYPGRVVPKDPVVENTGVSDIYIFLEITVPKRESVKVVDDNEQVKVITNTENNGVQLFTYEINPNWEEVESDYRNSEYNRYVYGYKGIIVPGKKTNSLFDEVKFLNVLEGDIEMNTELIINVNAMAVQSDYIKLSDTSLRTIYNETIKLYQTEVD